MRIDVHTHVFTLYSILSREAVRVITQRLEYRGVPKPLADAVGDLLYEQLDRPEYLDEVRLLERLIHRFMGVPSLSEAARARLRGTPFELGMDSSLDDVVVRRASEFITSALDAVEAEGLVDTVVDVIQTLRQSMKPTITDVADDLLAHMERDDVMVALMMDIFGAPELEQDRRRYLAQIEGTAEAALQRPGRILPFFGLHPERPGHFDELRRAVEEKGFVGVKLYPSLGYSVDSPEMRRVYTYCLERELPVLLHCGHGGFFRTREAIELCNPIQWTDVLRDFEGLRVCFAHFGGWEALGRRHCLGENWPPPEQPDARPEDNWGRTILEFMKRYPGVYTDLAKHVAMFEPEHESQFDTYFKTLRELVADPEVGPRILFGTDAWLLRLDMPFERYWTLWREGAGTAWDAITVEGPRRFVGLEGDDPAGWRANIRNFVRHMAAHRDDVGDAPAAWLARAVAEPFHVRRDPPDWDFHRQAVRDTYQFLGQFLSARQAEEGYLANRTRRLRDLPYYDPADPNFGGRCRDMARRFVDFAEQGMGFRGAHDFASAVEVFIDVFREGRMRFCEVAVTLNQIIDYPDVIA